MIVLTVPGALEIPTALAIALDAAAARKKPYDGAVALGCVILRRDHSISRSCRNNPRAG